MSRIDRMKRWYTRTFVRIVRHSRLKALIEWSKNVSLPGFYGVPIFNVLVFLFLELRNVDMMLRANAVAFSIILSTFPALIVLITLIPYMPVGDIDLVLINTLDEFLPSASMNAVMDIVHDLVNNPRGSLLSIGIFMTLFFASSGMLDLMRGFEKAGHKKTFKKRSYLMERWLAIKMIFLVVVLLLVSTVFIVAGNQIIMLLFTFLDLDQLTKTGLSTLRWVLSFVILYTVISILFRYGPPLKKKFPFVSPGALVSSVLCVMASVLFSLYVDNFGRYNEIYGSLGAFIVIMIWLQANSFIILVGFELNASIAINRDLLAEQTEEERDEPVETAF